LRPTAREPEEVRLLDLFDGTHSLGDSDDGRLGGHDLSNSILERTLTADPNHLAKELRLDLKVAVHGA
jgi:hypothetical protein